MLLVLLALACAAVVFVLLDFWTYGEWSWRTLTPGWWRPGGMTAEERKAARSAVH
jgi:hypothetical protein